MGSKIFGFRRKEATTETMSTCEPEKPEDSKNINTAERQVSKKAQSSVAAKSLRDPVADDLMRRVTQAIDGWIIDNNLEKLPRHIAFQQALSILNALDRTYTGETRK